MNYLAILLLLSFSGFATAGMDDDPLLVFGAFERLEWSDTDEGKIEGELWLGRDINKWVLQTEWHGDSSTESLSWDMFHRRAISAYWDFELGIRTTNVPGPNVSWFRMGVSGVAPYFIESEFVLYLKEDLVLLQAELEHEMPLNANWIWLSRLEFNVASETDESRHIGQGVGEVELGFDLKYERHKNVHPYIGFRSTHHFGDAADMTAHPHENSIVVGISAWF